MIEIFTVVISLACLIGLLRMAYLQGLSQSDEMLGIRALEIARLQKENDDLKVELVKKEQQNRMPVIKPLSEYPRPQCDLPPTRSLSAPHLMRSI